MMRYYIRTHPPGIPIDLYRNLLDDLSNYDNYETLEPSKKLGYNHCGVSEKTAFIMLLKYGEYIYCEKIVDKFKSNTDAVNISTLRENLDYLDE